MILTSPVGGSTVEAQHNLGVEVPGKLRDYLTLGAIRDCVNLAELRVSPLRAPDRLVHLHHDRPGVMANVPAAMSSVGLNVSQVHLETQGGFGAAVIYVSVTVYATTLRSLRDINGTACAFSVFGSLDGGAPL